MEKTSLQNEKTKLLEKSDHNNLLIMENTEIIPDVVTSSSSTSNLKPKVYRKRFLILILFSLFAMSNTYQWNQYTIINNIVAKYYDISGTQVNITAMVYMIIYIIGIVPATWLTNHKGIRFVVIFGSFTICLGSWMKCFSVAPNRFWLAVFGQTITSISTLFTLSLPANVASCWFPHKETSRATATIVIGNTLGFSIGFIIPSFIVENVENLDEISDGLKKLFYSNAIIMTILFILFILFFDDKPPLPPTFAQHKAELSRNNTKFINSFKSLMSNGNFVLLLFSYGLLSGVFTVLATVINQMVIKAGFANGNHVAGIAGMIITIVGVFGLYVCGVVLDKTHKFKQTTIFIYIVSLASEIGFLFILSTDMVWLLYLISASIGFFFSADLLASYEFAAEISYPHSESMSTGYLNACAQFLGFVLTTASSLLIDNYGNLPANILLTVIIVIGLILTLLTKSDNRRKQAEINER